MPVNTEKFMWNNIFNKNFYLEEVFKILLSFSDSFVPILRDSSKFATVFYFIIISLWITFLNIRRSFYYDIKLDNI